MMMMLLPKTLLLRFVVDLLCNKLYNKSTTDRSSGVCDYYVGLSYGVTTWIIM